MIKKELRCALIFLGPFPIGNVSTIRIMTYCKALVKKGVFVKVLLIAPTAEAAVNKSRSGVVDGVHYQYITDITWNRKNVPKFIKLAYYVAGLFKSLEYIRADKINCLLTYRDEFLSNVFYRIATKMRGIPFIIDKTEYPVGYFKMPAFRKRFERLKLKMFDGFITITSELKKFYYREIKKPESHYFLLPMTMDMNRYAGLQKQQVDEPYIAVVFGTHNRDGLFESIKAYKKYRSLTTAKPYRLVLIGDLDELCKNFRECNDIKSYIERNGLQASVDIKGMIPINDVPQLLLNADCLLTTPLAYVSGGFPTKLGEYLLSGVPVVATSAGEINNFLTDKLNILLSLPNDDDAVADHILYLQQNPREMEKIGQAGKRLVAEVFNADTYVDDLILFLKGLFKE